MPVADHHFIFLAGLHRSGTTMLQRILSEHPDISGFRNTGSPEDEGQHLQTVLPGARNFGGPSRFCLKGDAYRNAVAKLATAENRATIFAEWSKYWNLNKPWLLEKSPPNTLRAPYLERMFPESRFIYIVRHPLPVAFSMAERQWGKDSIPVLVRNWCAGYRYATGDIPELKHALMIRYEDLMETPQPVMQKIYGFLAITPQATAGEAIRPANDKHFHTWEEFVKQHRLQAWQVRRLEPQLRRFGYSFESPYIHPMEPL